MKRLARWSLNFILCVFYKAIYTFIKVEKDTFLFMSFHGRGFSDNPKSIYEYLKQRYPEKKYIWVLNDEKKASHCYSVRFGSIKFFYYLAKSKYWIFNCKTYPYMIKKKNQVYLQTWHGTPLKRLGHDINVNEKATFYRSGLSSAEMKKTYDDDVKKYDYMISPNPFSTDVFQSAFRIPKEKLIETGYPRNDKIQNSSIFDINKLKEKYKIPFHKQIILYAPTWRDNIYNNSGYAMKLQIDFDCWNEILGRDYVILYKPHYLIVDQIEIRDELKNFVYEIDSKSDINELYLLSDILITDYSSVFFDYAILEKPIYFYMYDLEEYKNELRGFYLDIHKELPGKIYKDENTLLSDIKNNIFDYDKLYTFNRRFNSLHDGNATKRVLNVLLQS
ncbi:CDP-glycerol glycerophosphotransferase family protein [[Clostridium] innocuum]|nr:CDP-glycerol glycerophosphotransferase family protein [[Clostridium] innocuum]